MEHGHRERTFLTWFWNPKKPVDMVLDEYASFYLGPEAATGRKLLDLLDNGCMDPQRKQKIAKRSPGWKAPSQNG